MNDHVGFGLKTCKFCSYLLPIRISPQILLASLLLIEANFYASLLILGLKKVRGRERGRKNVCIQLTSKFGVFVIILISWVSEDEQFEADKAQVVKEIAALEPK